MSENIERNVKENPEVFAPDEELTFATVHNVVAEVPPENILAIYETLKGLENIQ